MLHELGVSRPVLQFPRAQGDPETSPKAASAAVGGMLEYSNGCERRCVGHGGAWLFIRLAGRSHGVG